MWGGPVVATEPARRAGLAEKKRLDTAARFSRADSAVPSTFQPYDHLPEGTLLSRSLWLFVAWSKRAKLNREEGLHFLDSESSSFSPKSRKSQLIMAKHTYLFSDSVAHSCAEPGQDSERASLPHNGEQVHILAQAWIQVLCFSYGVPDKSAIRLLLSEEE